MPRYDASPAVGFGLRLMAVIGVIGIGAVSAGAEVVIDFNGLPAPHNLLSAPYLENGYWLTSTSPGQVAEINGFQPNGLLLRGTTRAPQVVRLTKANDDPFDLLSIAIGDNSLAGATQLTASSGASRLIVDSDLGLVIGFGSSWQNLDWVDFTVANASSGAPGQLTADNITVITVPEPGTLTAILMMLVGSWAGRCARVWPASLR